MECLLLVVHLSLVLESWGSVPKSVVHQVSSAGLALLLMQLQTTILGNSSTSLALISTSRGQMVGSLLYLNRHVAAQ